jgi:prevent-host-death family protein
MYDIVSDMKTVSVREVQHNLAAVLEMVSRGQEIAVTKRGRVIARIVPARDRRERVEWPDAAARMRRLGQGASRGTPASTIITETRGERV